MLFMLFACLVKTTLIPRPFPFCLNCCLWYLLRRPQYCELQSLDSEWLSLLLKSCASPGESALSETQKLLLDLHYWQNWIAFDSCAILNTWVSSLLHHFLKILNCMITVPLDKRIARSYLSQLFQETYFLFSLWRKQDNSFSLWSFH